MKKSLLLERVENIEKMVAELKKPKSVLGEVEVNQKTLTKAKKALFDFDIERFVTKKDLKSWK